jgi:hypothetical protein
MFTKLGAGEILLRSPRIKRWIRGVRRMAQDLRQAIAAVAGHPGPLFSAYLSVNADIPENQGGRTSSV